MENKEIQEVEETTTANIKPKSKLISNKTVRRCAMAATVMLLAMSLASCKAKYQVGSGSVNDAVMNQAISESIMLDASDQVKTGNIEGFFLIKDAGGNTQQVVVADKEEMTIYFLDRAAKTVEKLIAPKEDFKTEEDGTVVTHTGITVNPLNNVIVRGYNFGGRDYLVVSEVSKSKDKKLDGNAYTQTALLLHPVTDRAASDELNKFIEKNKAKVTSVTSVIYKAEQKAFCSASLAKQYGN